MNRSSIVAKQVAVGAGKVRGRAVRATDAGQPVVDFTVDFRRPANVVADEEVEVAVAVVVEERGPGAPGIGVAGDANGLGDVDESSTNVAHHAIPTERGDIGINVSVAVVIADRNPHAVQGQIETGRRGNVLERPFAEVAVKV